MNESDMLWQPSQKQIEASNLHGFMRYAEEKTGLVFDDYASLYQWSIDDSEIFWSLLWDWCEVVGDKSPRVLENGDKIEQAKWFSEARLNFAENLLVQRGNETAIHFRAEDQSHCSLNYGELYQQVAAVAAWMRRRGVVKGDRVAGYLPNMPETIVVMLAATSLGAIWTSTSPDFGEASVVEVFSN